MHHQTLNGGWVLSLPDGERINGIIPGSVYSFLYNAGRMEDPYYRDNELDALKLMEEDYRFARKFVPDGALLNSEKVVLRCEGLDTLCTVSVNGREVGAADNMHRIWEFDITGALCESENEITVSIASPTRYIHREDEKNHVGGTKDAMVGFPHLRKAHCMFGWDWGPRLPDAGIWRDIALVGINSSRIENIHIRQRHENGSVALLTNVEQSGDAAINIHITGPDGGKLKLTEGEWTPIPKPALWWPNGLGEQPLYTVTASLIENGVVTDSTSRRIGLRTFTVVREKDEWGESFAQTVNGVAFFAMGADYIPEDNLLSRITPERTRRLLEQCVAANFNSVRVWGGGYYPDDFFYNACDELGLVVWQDFMFACANYYLDDEERFEKNIAAELTDNIRRLRHHASLGLWCGNNEMEMFQVTRTYDGSDLTRAHYIRMFEHLFPHILRREDPDTFYWPASPSSGGSFERPNDPDRGDVHYWEVWHGKKPFAEYRKHYFRYASEFGFQSFPNIKTVESFTLPEDRNIFSRVMEMHQRNDGANGTIMYYLSQTFLYPGSFENLLYASQLLQAEAIRYGVEHWRRNRGRCMGAIYWQLNDIWPVASWASVDYFGRWKALHYYARRFFAPVMLSCEETGENTNRTAVVNQPSKVECKAALCVSNETREAKSVKVCWKLCGSRSETLREGTEDLNVPAQSSVWLDTLDFTGIDYLETHFAYEMFLDGKRMSSGSVLFTAPKHYHFANPKLTAKIEGRTIVISAEAYAKSVEIEAAECDLILSDNYFDMEKGVVKVDIIEGTPKAVSARSVFDIR